MVYHSTFYSLLNFGYQGIKVVLQVFPSKKVCNMDENNLQVT